VFVLREVVGKGELVVAEGKVVEGGRGRDVAGRIDGGPGAELVEKKVGGVDVEANIDVEGTTDEGGVGGRRDDEEEKNDGGATSGDSATVSDVEEDEEEDEVQRQTVESAAVK
jgi:hypothetical protein